MGAKSAARHVWWRLIGCAMLACTVVGCQPTTPDVPLTEPLIRDRWLSWIGDGRTSRKEVVEKLGEPTGAYEGGRIVAYHLYLSNPRCAVTDKNFRQMHGRGFGKLEPDTQLLAVHPGGPPDTHLRKYLSPATFALVLAYDEDVVRAHTLLRSSP